MLYVRKDWNGLRSGAVALDLLRQVRSEQSRQVFCRLLIRSALDLAVTTYFGRKDRTMQVREVSSTLWTIGGLRYLYVPLVNDHALTGCEEIFSDNGGGFVIVPAGCDMLFRRALEATGNRGRLHVQSFDGFVCWRTFHACLDAEWPNGRVLLHLFRTYNCHVTERQLSKSMHIQLPREMSKLESAEQRFRIIVTG